MTSSCNQEREAAAFGIRPMEYPVVPGMQNPAAGLPSPETERGGSQQAPGEEAWARQLEAVRREAVEQGKQMAAAESSAWRQQRAAELTRATEAFRASRDTYLAEVEKEVVRLALAVAEKILHRESRIDPLLLSGAVRKALGQLADSTEVRLRVPEAQQDLWTDVVRLMPGLPLRPQVAGDAELPSCEVILESSLGTVDLSVRAQLEEIERAFFDRVEPSGQSGHNSKAKAASEGGSA